MIEISVYTEIEEERNKAEAKFPDQHLPSGTSRSDWSGEELAAKAECNKRHKYGNLTWRDVLYEEVCEAFAEEDPAKLRAELVQVAAMAVRWIEDLGRGEKS